MQSIQNVFDRMGSNFLVAAFVPSLAFIISAMIVFRPIIPDSLYNTLLGQDNNFFQGAIALFIFSGIIGFTLTSLNIFILKIFEGYILIWRIPFFRQSEVRRSRRLKQRIYRIQQMIRRLETVDHPRIKKRLSALRSKEYELLAEYQYSFPLQTDQILPTPFGNILRASEVYAGDRYGIDAVPLYPRLIHSIPESYQKRLDQSLDQLSFLVNCAVLSIGFAFLCFCGAIYTQLYVFISEKALPNFSSFLLIDSGKNEIYQRAGIFYLLIGIPIGLVAAIIFQRATLVNVAIYGDLIRSIFDLFRFDLLKLFRLELPNNSTEEGQIWNKLSSFLIFGRQKNPMVNFDYHHDKDKGETS
jgi:hypothetical protein